MKTIVVGVGGGIAAYKTCELVRLLAQAKHDVHVVLTEAAQEFVTPLTFQTLSKNPVHTGMFKDLSHITLADRADAIVVAPATADLIAKAAQGLANDLLTTILLATKAPVLFCPSMNVNMWNHRATQANVARLKELGYRVLEPAEGELACGWEGKGRLVEPEHILAAVQNLLG